ncbi:MULTISPECIES: DUF3180 domain-containing protein [Kocuria]|uniref:DUF3180 domain-containing protein n=1 Tax=Kocuria subflava TaxID=1736139 RepID=A0A846TXI1_9MICC|nr:DUF3180 domain-containing protein [Kocuria sp. CPCC 104605]NKE10344.1 DUF3180 domain-containing protein [Kocuria subflava]
MRPLTIRLLMLVAAFAFAGSWAADLLSSRLGGPLLSLPWAAGIALLVQAAAVLIVGWQVRKIRDGDREVRLDRTWGAVTASLAQANAVVGALMAGWHGLLVNDQAMLIPVRSNHAPLWLVIGMTVIGIVMCVLGWVVEGFCRLPPDDPADTARRQEPHRAHPAQEGGMARTRELRARPDTTVESPDR